MIQPRKTIPVLFVAFLIGLPSKATGSALRSDASDAEPSADFMEGQFPMAPADGEVIIPVAQDVEGAEAPVTDGLTEMRCWAPKVSPPMTARLKFAAACHQRVGAWYGIPVVFHFEMGVWSWDTLYYLLVDGASTWGAYGELAWQGSIVDEDLIENIDCATDDNYYVYVAWDRPPGFAQWVRITGASVSAQHAVDIDCGATGAASHKPRIATAPTGKVVVTYHGYPSSCLLCMQGFSSSGTPLNWSSFNYDWGVTPYDWDLVWNDIDRFVVGFRYRWEGGDYVVRFATIQLDDQGSYIEGTHVTLMDWPYMDPNTPIGSSLVYTNNSRNSWQRLVLITDRRTFWINRSTGALQGTYTGYSSVPNAAYASCEYWGPRYRAGHSYTDRGGAGTWYTVHRHWGRGAGVPTEVYNINNGYNPAACSSSDTYDDEEVVVVSSPSGSASVCWNVEPED